MRCRSIKQLALSCFIVVVMIGLMTKPVFAVEVEGIVSRVMIPICPPNPEGPTHILSNPCNDNHVLLRPIHVALLRSLDANVGQFVKVEGQEIMEMCRMIEVQYFWTLTQPDCCEGDLEPNGAVDEYDLSIFSDAFGQVDNSPNETYDGDLDDDGDVDGVDMSKFVEEFGRTDCP